MNPDLKKFTDTAERDLAEVRAVEHVFPNVRVDGYIGSGSLTYEAPNCDSTNADALRRIRKRGFVLQRTVGTAKVDVGIVAADAIFNMDPADRQAIIRIFAKYATPFREPLRDPAFDSENPPNAGPASMSAPAR